MKRLQTYIHWRERGGVERRERETKGEWGERKGNGRGRRRRRGGGGGRERESVRDRRREQGRDTQREGERWGEGETHTEKEKGGGRERHTQRRRKVGGGRDTHREGERWGEGETHTEKEKGGGRERHTQRRRKVGGREKHTQRRRKVNIDAIDDVRPQQVTSSWRMRRKNGTVTIGMFARAARDVLLQRGETSALLCSSDGDPSAANSPFPARCSKHAAVHLPAAGRCDDSIACTWDDIEAGYVICRGRV